MLGALFGPWLGALVVETWVKKKPPVNFGWLKALRQGAVVGLAVVAGLLVSRLAQLVLAVLGVAAFVGLSLR